MNVQTLLSVNLSMLNICSRSKRCSHIGHICEFAINVLNQNIIGFFYSDINQNKKNSNKGRFHLHVDLSVLRIVVFNFILSHHFVGDSYQKMKEAIKKMLIERPVRDSNPCYQRERLMSQASRRTGHIDTTSLLCFSVTLLNVLVKLSLQKLHQ